MRGLLAWLPALLWLAPLTVGVAPGELLMFLSALLLHEGGHLFGFLLCKEPSPSLSPHPMGLCLRPRRPLPYRRELLIAALGPLANLFFGLPLIAAARTPATLTLGAVHLLTALTNLLPLPATDGGRLIADLLALLLPLPLGERIGRGLFGAVALALLFASLYLLLCGAGASVLLCFLLLFTAYRRPPRHSPFS